MTRRTRLLLRLLGIILFILCFVLYLSWVLPAAGRHLVPLRAHELFSSTTFNQSLVSLSNSNLNRILTTPPHIINDHIPYHGSVVSYPYPLEGTFYGVPFEAAVRRFFGYTTPTTPRIPTTTTPNLWPQFGNLGRIGPPETYPLEETFYGKPFEAIARRFLGIRTSTATPAQILRPLAPNRIPVESQAAARRLLRILSSITTPSTLTSSAANTISVSALLTGFISASWIIGSIITTWKWF
jgi:hypothetical protein